MKTLLNPFLSGSALGGFVALITSAGAAPLFKDATTTDINTLANWSTTSGVATPDPGSFGSTDTLRFNETFAPTNGTSYTATLSGDLTVGGIKVDSGTGGGGSAFGNIVINGSSTLTLNGTTSGDSQYSGAIIVLNSSAGGTLTVNPNIVIGAASTQIVASRNVTLNGSLNLGAFGLSSNIAGGTTTLNGVVSGNSGFTKGGAGTATFTAANSYTGSTVINQGTVSLAGSAVLGGAAGSTSDTGNIVFGSSLNSGTLNFETVASLGPASQVRFRNTGGTAGSGGALVYSGTTAQILSKTIQCDTGIGIRLESNSVGGSLLFNGAFSQSNRSLYLGGTGTGANTLATGYTGNGGITKRGTGTWALTGTNTYIGATQVNAGRLHLTGSLTSAITVASGASLSGTGSTSGLLTLSSGGGLALAGGLTTSSVTANGATFVGSNLVTFLSNPVPGAVYDLFTYGNGAVTTANNLSVAWRGSVTNDTANKKYVFTAGSSGTRTWATASGTWSQGSTSTWSEGDQTFYAGDSVVFAEPASAATVALSGRLAAGSVLVNNTTNPYTFSGTDGTSDITGGASLTKSGSGKLIFTSAQTYTGTTTISGGVLEVGTGSTSGSLGSGAVSVAAGAELVFNRSNEFTVANTISGAGLITKKGGGRLWVTADNSVGALTWNFSDTGNKDIGFTNANSLGGSGSTITVAAGATGSTFFATNGNNSDVGISIGSGGVFTWNGSTGNISTLTGVISGAGALTKVSGETLRLSGLNSYTGATTISGGTLELYGAGQLGSGSYAGNIANAATLSVNTSADQTLSGVISGAGALTKANIGKLTLSGANTYTGATSATAGSLIINGTTSANSLVTIGSAATLGGGGTVGGDTTVNGFLAPGNSPGLLTFTGDLSFGSGASVLWELAASVTSGRGTSWDAVNVGGDLTFTGATTFQPIFNAAGSSVDFNDAVWAQALGLSGGWRVLDVSGSINGLENLAVASGDFVDSQGNLLSSVRPGLSMLLYQNNGGIYLTTVSAIPEPAALFGLAGLLAGGCLVRRRGV